MNLQTLSCLILLIPFQSALGMKKITKKIEKSNSKRIIEEYGGYHPLYHPDSAKREERVILSLESFKDFLSDDFFDLYKNKNVKSLKELIQLVIENISLVDLRKITNNETEPDKIAIESLVLTIGSLKNLRDNTNYCLEKERRITESLKNDNSSLKNIIKKNERGMKNLGLAFLATCAANFITCTLGCLAYGYKTSTCK